jgi:hypothetical protein
MKVDAIVFDLGGVLVDIDLRRAFTAWGGAAGVPADVIETRFAVDDACCAHERGEIDDRTYFAYLRSALGLPRLSDEQMLASGPPSSASRSGMEAWCSGSHRACRSMCSRTRIQRTSRISPFACSTCSRIFARTFIVQLGGANEAKRSPPVAAHRAAAGAARSSTTWGQRRRRTQRRPPEISRPARTRSPRSRRIAPEMRDCMMQLCAVVTLALASLLGTAFAAYPDRLIKVLMPFRRGTVDVVTRLVCNGLPSSSARRWCSTTNRRRQDHRKRSRSARACGWLPCS